MSRIRTIVRVEIDNIYDRNLLRDNPATAAEVAELAAECDRVGIPDDITARHSAYCFEAPLAETNLAYPDDAARLADAAFWCTQAMFVRGRINLQTAEHPSWRAARRYPNGDVMYLDKDTGRQAKMLSRTSRNTFIAEGDES